MALFKRRNELVKAQGGPVIVPGARVTSVPPWQVRVAQAARYVVSSVSPSTWFGPDQPITPFGPEESKGRALDYMIGYNIGIVPRQEEAVTFNMMRTLADNYDLLRSIIETRKDQIAKMPWDIVFTDDSKNREDSDRDPDVIAIKEKLAMPDNEHAWDTWLRAGLEDLFVVDAWTVYPRMTKGGDVYSLDLMDGTMFKRVIDAWGRTPTPPDPAYQQIVHGVPMADYTRDELIYYPRNYRTHKLYGMSPVEQGIVCINLGLRREISQLNYFTEGTMPDAIVQLPESWSPDQIKDYQQWFDSLTSWDDRRKVRMMPGGSGAGIHLTKEPALKTDFDEWAARILCFLFSIPPTPFIRQMNRSVAETAQQTALEEGLIPLLQFVESMMTLLIVKFFKKPQLKFKFILDRDNDPHIQAQIDDINLKNGSTTINEVREKRGDASIGPDGDVPMIYTPSPPTKLADVLNPPEPVAPAPNGQGSQESATNGKGKPPAPGDTVKLNDGLHVHLHKRVGSREGFNATLHVQDRAELEELFKDFLAKQGKVVASRIRRRYAGLSEVPVSGDDSRS